MIRQKILVVSVAAISSFFGVGDLVLAASIVGRFSANGLSLSTQATARYVGDGSTPADFDMPPDDSKSGTVDFLGPVVTTSVTATKTPAMGAAKDVAEVTATLQFEFGDPHSTLPNDGFTFSATGNVSAVSAFNTAGNPSAAIAASKGSLRFFIDAGFGGAPPAGTVVGALDLPGLSPLTAWEVVKHIEVFENSVTIGMIEPGDGPLTLPLKTANSYEVRTEYVAHAPFGVDPPFHFDYRATLVEIPEPAAGVSFLAAALAILTLTRRSGFVPIETYTTIS